MRYKTRKGKLEYRIKEELNKQQPNLNRIIEIIEEFEIDNIKTIDKLKKRKNATLRKVNGALKQSINAHGPITKDFLGSASKRIYGAILEVDEENEKECSKVSMRDIIIGFFCGIILFTLIQFVF